MVVEGGSSLRTVDLLGGNQPQRGPHFPVGAAADELAGDFPEVDPVTFAWISLGRFDAARHEGSEKRGGRSGQDISPT
jgi:hypothetical protein